MLFNDSIVHITETRRDGDSELNKKQNEGFWLRKWDSLDVASLCYFIVEHILAACALFVFNWGAFYVASLLFWWTQFSVIFGYHRLLTHRSFKTPKWLEYFFAYSALLAGQRDPIYWVSVHKYHHQYADTDRDPHTPKQGFWYGHMGWLFNSDYVAVKCGESRSGVYSNVVELKEQWFYRFLHETYIWHLIALGTLLYLYGGFSYLAWGMGMRQVLSSHLTFLVNSVGHTWGPRPWNTRDTSTNNWVLGMLAFGDGWHNNHHAFPKSARHGLEWWQFDFVWEVIKFLEMVGLATDIKLPTQADITRMATLSSKQTN